MNREFFDWIAARVDPELTRAIGLTVVHFVWQGVVLGGICAIFLFVRKTSSPQARYGIALAGLACMAIAPIATMSWIYSSNGVQSKNVASVDSVPPQLPMTPKPGFVQPGDSTLRVQGDPASGIAATAVEANDSGRLADDSRASLADVRPASELTVDKPEPKLTAFASWFCFLWIAGVACMTLRLAAGWLGVVVAKRIGTTPAPTWLVKLINELRQRLAVRQAVQCWQSSRVAIPAVVGWLRPVILLPASALTGLSPDQIKMVLAHELAHIRRHDFLVNVFQSLVETLLFYHPAVWLLSQRIRAEREFCCDDLAMAVGSDRVAYAKALSALESTRSSSSLFAISSQGGPLMVRIRRILGLPVGNRASLRPSVSFVASTLLLLLTATGFALAKSPTKMIQEPIPAESQEPKSIADQKILLRTEVEKRRSDREGKEAKLAELDQQNATFNAQSLEKSVEQVKEKVKNVQDAVALQRAKDAIDELLRTTNDPVKQKQYQAWLQTLGNTRSVQGAVQQAIDKGHLDGGALIDVVPTPSGIAETLTNQDPIKPLLAVDPSNVPQEIVNVFALKHCSATDIADAINSLGREFWDADPPRIVADAHRNTLITAGTLKQREQLEALLKLLEKNAAKDLPAEADLPQAKKPDIVKKMQVHFFQLELERANLNLTHASKELDQFRELRSTGTTSAQELNRAEHAHDLAQLEQRFAQLKLEAAEQGVELLSK